MPARKRCFWRLKAKDLRIDHFRAHVSAAPLKQYKEFCLPSSGSKFPRSRERGPIEADRRWAQGWWFGWYFRAHVSAAPLKRRMHAACSHHAKDFRAHVSAAPLKPPASRRGQRSTATFPRSRERGPIEARKRTSCAISPKRFPRSRERGPIEAA